MAVPESYHNTVPPFAQTYRKNLGRRRILRWLVERADRAEGERDELRAELARRRAEFLGAQARQRATFTQEQHRAEAAEAREAALREALEVGRGSFRKLIRHHRDDHHHGTQPYDQEVATGLWQMERALAADGLVQQLGMV